MHDGHLLGLILLDKANELELRLGTAMGDKITIKVPHLVALQANNFRQGNIVFEISLYTEDNCPVGCLQKAYGYDKMEWEQYGANKLSEIGRNWSLIEIRESYGCELYALSGAKVDKWIIEQSKLTSQP